MRMCVRACVVFVSKRLLATHDGHASCQPQLEGITTATVTRNSERKKEVQKDGNSIAHAPGQRRMNIASSLLKRSCRRLVAKRRFGSCRLYNFTIML